MVAQAMAPAIFSIRRPQDEPPQDYPGGLADRVTYLPEDQTLTQLVKDWHAAKKIPRKMRHLLMDWPGQVDKHRVYAAAWLGPRLRRAGVRHVHVHFAGIAARTAYWLKKFYGISYSFTGHANDIFREDQNLPVKLADLVREARLVATVSEFSAAELRRKFPQHTAQIHVAYNGIELSKWPPKQESGTEAPHIITVGRLIEKKGFADLIEACGHLHQQNISFQCSIVGEGPLQQQLQAAIDELQLQDHVQLSGPRPQNRIAELMRSSRVFALPCVVERDGGMDNLPTVIMEAMASGLPCVSTKLAGVPEMIADNTSGTLTEPGDTQALAAALASYLTDAGLASAHGKHGRHMAEQQFALPVTTRHLKHLLVASGRVTPPFSAIKTDQKLTKIWFSGWLRRIYGQR